MKITEAWVNGDLEFEAVLVTEENLGAVAEWSKSRTYRNLTDDNLYIRARVIRNHEFREAKVIPGDWLARMDGKLWHFYDEDFEAAGFTKKVETEHHNAGDIEADVFIRQYEESITKRDSAVDHPNHYNQYEGLEIIDLIEQMPFNRGSIVKYVARAGFKSPETELQDLKKARFYIEREISRVETREASK